MYKTISLYPADGSKLGKNTPRNTDMKSVDGRVEIKWHGRRCCLVTSKGVYRMDRAKSNEVYWARIDRWLVFYNGAELSWREAP